MPKLLTVPASARSVSVRDSAYSMRSALVATDQSLLVHERQAIGDALAERDDLRGRAARSPPTRYRAPRCRRGPTLFAICVVIGFLPWPSSDADAAPSIAKSSRLARSSPCPVSSHDSFSPSGTGGFDTSRTRGTRTVPVTSTPASTARFLRSATTSSAGLSTRAVEDQAAAVDVEPLAEHVVRAGDRADRALGRSACRWASS